MLDFNEKIAAVTGAASGIGQAAAAYLFQCGATVIMLDVNEKGVVAEAKKLDPTGRKAMGKGLDISSSKACGEVMDSIKENFGRLDNLVHCAGIYPWGSVAETSDEDWRKLMSVNLDGTFYICRSALTIMREGSSFVLCESVASHRGSARAAAYSSSKGGVLSLMRSLCLECGQRNIRANAVAGGMIATPMTQKVIDAHRERYEAAIPLKRVGEPSEVATVIAFLCSSLASFVNGETIHINGGAYMD